MGNRVLGLYMALTGALACGTPAVFAATEADIANERPPSNALQLEQYWRVDCLASAAALHAALEQLRANCVQQPQAHLDAQAWQQPLRLCAAIHQPPGTDTRKHCPDYAALTHYLQPHGAVACLAGEARIASLQEMLECAAIPTRSH
jgi:hypothetical protein